MIIIKIKKKPAEGRARTRGWEKKLLDRLLGRGRTKNIIIIIRV